MARVRRANPGLTKDIPEGWTPRIRSAADLDELLERLPSEPGVYIMRDRKGEVVYVGKARRLKARVRQYFDGTDTRYFVPRLAGLLGDIEWVVTSSDKEAMLLENTLIKTHSPRFNFKLRDDKQFLLVRIDPKAQWPRLELVRQSGGDGADYYGPYHSASRARQTLRVVNRHFRLRTCTDHVLATRKRPCLQYQIGRCPAPCVFEVDRAEYGEQVAAVRKFLGGRTRDLVRDLEVTMASAAEALEFERAARVRDQLDAIRTTLESQQVIGERDVDRDAVGMYREGGQVEVVVAQIRGGVLVGTHTFSERGMELADADVLRGFLEAYYEHAHPLPHELLLSHALHDDDAAVLSDALSARAARKVALAVPERGERRKLVLLALKNASTSFSTRRNKAKDVESTLRRLQQVLSLSRLPRRIECFDVSHLQGTEPVASMVTFLDGLPDKPRYRTFRIKGDVGPLTEIAADLPAGHAADLAAGQGRQAAQNDDFRSMYEALTRRLRRGLDVLNDPSGTDGIPSGDAAGAARDASDDREADAWTLPDLLVIDGGKGQLSRVLAAMQDLGIPLGAEGIDVVALAKEREFELGRGRAALARLEAHHGGRRRAASAEGSEAQGPGAVATPSARSEESDGEVSEHTRLPGEALADWTIAHADRPERLRESVGDGGVETVGDAEAGAPPARGKDGADARSRRPERVFLPGAKDAIVLAPGSSELHLMTRIRDEAHRFAIEFHRKRRGKRALASSLDGIPGIGPATKKALLRAFGSVKGIREAEEAALLTVHGVGVELARRIKAALVSRA
jgi:excinuclease ABC subunit C